MEQTSFVAEIKREMKSYDDKIAALRQQMEAVEQRARNLMQTGGKHLA